MKPEPGRYPIFQLKLKPMPKNILSNPKNVCIILHLNERQSSKAGKTVKPDCITISGLTVCRVCNAIESKVVFWLQNRRMIVVVSFYPNYYMCG